MTKLKVWQPAVISRLAVFLFATSSLCLFAQKGVDPAPSPGFTGVSFRVLNSTVPPGGTFQFQLLLTEPKPIGHGSTRPQVPTGTTTGISLNDPIGQTAGVAIFDSTGMQINFTSPVATFGTNLNLDYPILTIRTSIPVDSPVGLQFPLSIDLANSLWFDAAGQPYPQEIAPGKLTIGGTLAISDVLPGSGFQAAGTRITILGMGFRADSRVNIEGTTLNAGDIQFISPNELDVILPSGVQMEGNRVRVKNPDQASTFFAYLHTEPIGQSTHPLLAQTYPLFARQTYTSASLPWNRSGSQFTGIALQNPGADSATVTLQLQSAAGTLLGSASVSLPAGTKITRDLAEFFAGVSAETASMIIKSSAPVQMLGLVGDDATGDVVPVMVTAP